VIQDSSWNWYGEGSVVLPTGSGTSKFSVFISNVIPSSVTSVNINCKFSVHSSNFHRIFFLGTFFLTFFFFSKKVAMRTLSAYHANPDSAPLQTLSQSTVPTGSIRSAFLTGSGSSAGSNSVKIVKYPSQILANGKGAVEMTLEYTATTPAYISTSMTVFQSLFSSGRDSHSLCLGSLISSILLLLLLFSFFFV
jgi:hypothetical protein